MPIFQPLAHQTDALALTLLAWLTAPSTVPLASLGGRGDLRHGRGITRTPGPMVAETATLLT